MTEAGYKSRNAVPIRSGNASAIDWATGEHPPSARAKHIDVRLFYIRSKVQDDTVDVPYIATEENDADILTKPVTKDTLRSALKRLGLGSSTAEEC